MRLLNIVTSPRTAGSASIEVADAFLDALRARHDDLVVDTLDVWQEDLPEFDAKAIGAKYKGVSGEPMDADEQAVWDRIHALAARFSAADRIVLGVPMWNWAYPYKLKQLIDLVSQRGLLFTFDGERFGPGIDVERALVVFVRGQAYAEDGPTPASEFDHQTGFITFFLRTIGVRSTEAIVVEDTWDDAAADSVAAAKRDVAAFAADF